MELGSLCFPKTFHNVVKGFGETQRTKFHLSLWTLITNSQYFTKFKNFLIYISSVNSALGNGRFGTNWNNVAFCESSEIEGAQIWRLLVAINFITSNKLFTFHWVQNRLSLKFSWCLHFPMGWAWKATWSRRRASWSDLFRWKLRSEKRNSTKLGA